MLAKLLAFALLAADPLATDADDISAVKIPDGAVETRPSFRREGRRTQKREYRVGDELVAVRKYYDNGRLAEEVHYRHGKRHGIWKQFHLNGRLFAERPYRNGVMDGEFRFWDEHGELMGKSKIDRGNGLLREFGNDDIAAQEAETPYRNNKIHGRKVEWAHYLDCQGIGFSVLDYVDGRAEGINVTRHNDGLILGWAFFKDGKLHGPSIHLTRDGRLAEGLEPRYFINGDEVTEADFKAAAEQDPELAKCLVYRPPQYAKVPESPSQAFDRKRKASQRPQTKGKAGTKAEQKGE